MNTEQYSIHSVVGVVIRERSNKMKDRKFLEQVTAKLVDEGIECSVIEVQKVNTVQIGVSACLQKDISTIVYFNTFEGDSVDEGVEYVKETLENCHPIFGVPDIIEHFTNHISEVRFAVCNKEMNREGIVKNSIGFDFLDLWVYYRFPFTVEPNREGFITILDRHLDVIGADASRLFDYAMSNLRRECKYMDMFGAFEVLTNKSGFGGAAQLLNTEAISKFADNRGSDIAIIPSSIHEVLMIPVSNLPSTDGTDALKTMIEEVNRNVVQEEEVLSNHPYLFKRSEGKVTMF